MAKYIVNPVEVRMKESDKGSIYESIVAMGFRARQINDQMKQELQIRMSDVVEMDESEGPNFEQVAISREFDKQPKPTFISMKEMFNDKITYQLPDWEA